MFICNCNGLPERKVQGAIEKGASHWRQVHDHLGTAPKCGLCECEINDMIAEHRDMRADNVVPLPNLARAS